MFKAKRIAITLKNEVTPGVDVTPAAATDALLVRNWRVDPLKLTYEQREFAAVYFGNKGKIITGQFAQMSFEIEMAGGGAAGTIPKWGAAAQSCAMSETNTPGVSTVYAPITTGEKTSTIYWYIDGRLHKMVYSLGNLEAVLQAGKIPFLSFSFIGLHVQPTDVAIVTPTLTGFVKPLAVNNANTTPLTVHGFAGKVTELRFNTGNALPYRNTPNSEAIRFVDRSASGTVRMEDELVATKDWWTIIKGGTLGALAATQGTVAGNKVAIAAANVQLTEPQLDADDNVGMVRMSMDLQPSSAGNDEFSLTVT